MRILFIHNAYQHRGGEDAVVEAETALLHEAGHSVYLETVSNNSIHGKAAKVRAFLKTPYDSTRKIWIKRLLDRLKPDIVHIHNFFPLLTPAVHEAIVEYGIPVVQTLHNYRLLCAGALLMRQGKICEKCIGQSRYWSVLHRCYRQSALASFAVATMQRTAEQKNIWGKVDKFIALTEFAKSKFIEGGLPEDKLVVKSNFLESPQNFQNTQKRQGALFVGRLSPEKGVHVLLEAWKKVPDTPLRIAGDGPEIDHLKQQAPANVEFLGQLNAKEVEAEMLKAQALLIPSVWYEGFPMTVVEAYSRGLPVIASEIGSLQEVVREGVTGGLFTPSDPDDLANTVKKLFASETLLSEMSKASFETYKKYYTPEVNINILEKIYTDAIQARSL